MPDQPPLSLIHTYTQKKTDLISRLRANQIARVTSDFKIDLINNGDMTEWSPIRSVLIRAMNKSRV